MKKYFLISFTIGMFTLIFSLLISLLGLSETLYNILLIIFISFLIISSFTTFIFYIRYNVTLAKTGKKLMTSLKNTSNWFFIMIWFLMISMVLLEISSENHDSIVSEGFFLEQLIGIFLGISGGILGVTAIGLLVVSIVKMFERLLGFQEEIKDYEVRLVPPNIGTGFLIGIALGAVLGILGFITDILNTDFLPSAGIILTICLTPTLVKYLTHQLQLITEEKKIKVQVNEYSETSINLEDNEIKILKGRQGCKVTFLTNEVVIISGFFIREKCLLNDIQYIELKQPKKFLNGYLLLTTKNRTHQILFSKKEVEIFNEFYNKLLK